MLYLSQSLKYYLVYVFCGGSILFHIHISSLSQISWECHHSLSIHIWVFSFLGGGSSWFWIACWLFLSQLLAIGSGVFLEEFFHVARSLEYINSIILLSLLIGNHLKITFAAVVSVSLIIRDHLLPVLISKHFSFSQINSLLLFCFFFNLEVSLLIKHFCSFCLLLFSLFLQFFICLFFFFLFIDLLINGFTTDKSFAEGEHVGDRSIIILKIFKTLLRLLFKFRFALLYKLFISFVFWVMLG